MYQRGLVIIIIVNNKIEAKRLITNHFQIRKAIKKEEKYCNAELVLICIKYYKMSYEWQGNCENKPKNI